MTGFLCALGIAGGTALAMGWNDDVEAPWTTPLVFGGAGLLAIAGVGGLIRLAL
ncbi:hypothetical protein [Methylobacterium komagatae]